MVLPKGRKIAIRKGFWKNCKQLRHVNSVDVLDATIETGVSDYSTQLNEFAFDHGLDVEGHTWRHCYRPRGKCSEGFDQVASVYGQLILRIA